MRLLLESEAAEILRCSVETVRRLRRARALAYVPGRPPLIDEADLEQYLQQKKIPAIQKAVAKEEVAVNNTLADDAREWALNKVLMSKPRYRSNGRGKTSP